MKEGREQGSKQERTDTQRQTSKGNKKTRKGNVSKPKPSMATYRANASPLILHLGTV